MNLKSYIIRLKDNAISEKHAAECVEQAKKFGVDVHYFDAINGNDYSSHLKTLNIAPRYRFKKGRAGVYGCFLSHYYLWKNCIESGQPFLILEHDGYFIKPLPENILEMFDDVLKLDRFNPYTKKYNILIESEKENNISINAYINPDAKFLEKNQTGMYMKGAYGYIIKPHAAEKIISWISKNGFVPADQQIGNAIVDIKVTSPTIVRLHPAYFRNMASFSLTANPDLL